MTQTQTSGAAQPLPFAAMLRAAVKPSLLVSALTVIVFLVVRGSGPALASLLAVAVTVGFFAGGLYVMSRVVNANPLSVLSAAIAVYLGQMIVLGLIVFGLSGASWLDSVAFGMSALVVVIAWQVFLIVAFVRGRRPIYDTHRSDTSQMER